MARCAAARAASAARPGLLAAARQVRLGLLNLDDLPRLQPDELRIEATCQAADERQLLYGFTARHGATQLASGRITVVLQPQGAQGMTTSSGKRALITGASGALGRAIALRLAAGGAHVIAHANRRLDAVQALVEEIRAAGGQAQACQFDLTSREATHAACEALLRGRAGADPGQQRRHA